MPDPDIAFAFTNFCTTLSSTHDYSHSTIQPVSHNPTVFLFFPGEQPGRQNNVIGVTKRPVLLFRLQTDTSDPRTSPLKHTLLAQVHRSLITCSSSLRRRHVQIVLVAAGPRMAPAS